MVESVASEYENVLKWETVITKDLAGAMRFGELSKTLGRLAPIPSIFIDGELVFDITPSQEKLRDDLNRRLGR